MKDKYFAVFGDTHGHLRLMFQLARLWQVNNGRKLDGIFQCGDLGYYPNHDNLDRATRRFANRDAEELGFKFFTKPEPLQHDPWVDELLNGPKDDLRTVSCPVWFCHGNHEDFQLLTDEVGVDDVHAVDCYGRINWIRPGHVLDLDGLRVATLGGGAERVNGPADDYGLDDPWKWVGAKASKKLADQRFDVLLSHVSPYGIGGESDQWGSARLREVIDACQPQYNFYAHHKTVRPPVKLGETHSVWLNDVNFSQDAQVEAGCMGVLRWRDASDHEFAVVDDNWVKWVTPDTWQNL